MKHVWILNHYAQEPRGAGATRHFSLARHLRKYGWEATIVASNVEHNTGRLRSPGNERSREEVCDGVRFVWLRGISYDGNNAARIRNWASYVREVLREETFSGLQKPDAIIGSTVHPLAAWAGRRLARRHNVPFVFEIRDLWPETLVAMGRIRRHGLIAGAMRRLETALCRSAARIVVLMPRASEYLEGRGIPAGKIVWIPNGAGADTAPPPPRKRDEFQFMYFGAHGRANDLETLIRAMKYIRDAPEGRDIRLRMIGSGPMKSELIELAGRIGADNTMFEEPVARAFMPSVAAEADAFVICVGDHPELYRHGISMNKLYEYMAARRPTVIAAEVPDNPISEANAGICVPPEDPEALAKGMIRLAHMPYEQRLEMGRAARARVMENYSYDVLARRLADTLDAAVKER